MVVVLVVGAGAVVALSFWRSGTLERRGSVVWLMVVVVVVVNAEGEDNC